MLVAANRSRQQRTALAAVWLLTALVVGPANPVGGAALAGPQGTIVFASDRNGTFQIYSIRADGSQLGQLTHGRASDTAPLFSPDGRRIVFSRAPKRDTSDLWVMNADGSGQRKLARAASWPAWAPDSRRIAYAGSRSLVIVNVDSRRRVIVPGRNGRPYWSPDGRLIAFARATNPSGERKDLMVVRSDGRVARTIRKLDYQGSVLGWSPRGQIVFASSYGIGVVNADGRGPELVLRAQAPIIGVAWSPDGRQLAFVDGKLNLQVAPAGGSIVSDLTPKETHWVDALAWSPDSRWLAVRGRLPGAVYADVLVVAADGSGSRLLTPRVPYPWGAENGPPSWRPRGVTPTRLGSAPATPRPSETITESRFELAAPYMIAELAADGGRAALIVAGKCSASIEVWEPARRRVVRPQPPCGPHDDIGTGDRPPQGVTLAGTRVAWLDGYGANVQYTSVLTATLDRPIPVRLNEEGAISRYGFVASHLVGHGGLLAFTVTQRCGTQGDPPGDCPPGRKDGDIVGATIWRFGGTTHCGNGNNPSGGARQCTAVARADGELTTLAADGTRIVARTDDVVRLLTAAGRVLRDFQVEATAAALSGKRLALRTDAAVEVYDTDSGQLTDRVPVPKAVRLEDLEGDILITAAHATVTLRRLGDRRTITIRTDGTARAKLEQPGLFVAGSRRMTFTPMQDVLRRFGS